MFWTIVFWASMIIIIMKIWVKLTSGRSKSNVCLVGKTVLITGGNSGLGLSTAMALAGTGCRLIIASRNNSEEIRQKIIKETHNPNVVTKYLDLGSLESVRAFARDINNTEDRLDILVNNAGTSLGCNTSTKDGLVTLMQINYFGSFLLTHLLVDLLKKSAPSRIVFVNSLVAFMNDLNTSNINSERHWPSIFITFADEVTYGNSKLCQIIASNRFAEVLKNAGVTSNCVHPGLVMTPIFDKWAGQGGIHRRCLIAPVNLFAKSAEEGAETIIECCLANELQGVTGKYFVDCCRFAPPPKANDEDFAQKIWEASEKYVKLKDEEKLVHY